jgi:hypothetical protein
MEELYQKVIIRSEDDLPRDTSNQYWVHFETNDMFYEMAYKIRHLWEQGVVDWYLQPIQPLPQPREVTDEEIESHFRTEHYDNKNGHHYRINKDRIFGAKWMRSQMKGGAK